jgi:pyridoxamine 5'-phosphate oxidase
MRTDDPIIRFRQLLAQAEELGIELPNAAAFATAGKDLQPTVRILLLKDVDDRGFVFYTNMQSRKAVQISENPRASVCFWWPKLRQQVRVEGLLEVVSDAQADAYFATRPRGSQIAAWASNQSSEISSRAELMSVVAAFTAKYKEQPVPRPPHWTGYRLAPERIEFWMEQPDRLHERRVYTRERGGWKVALLAP